MSALQLLAILEIPFVHCNEHNLPHEKQYKFSHNEKLAVIFENTADGVKKANAVLFSYLLNYILPEEEGTINELKNAGYIVLENSEAPPITDPAILAKLFRDYRFDFHSFQCIPKVLTHSIPKSANMGNYNNEFNGEFRSIGFGWSIVPTSITNNLVVIEKLRNTEIYDSEFDLRKEQILDAVTAEKYLFASDVISQPIVVHDSQKVIDEYDFSCGLTIPTFSPLTVKTTL